MIRFIKPAVFILALLPIVLLSRSFYLDELGANPFEVFTRSTGEWTLRFLLITLAMTPLRQLTGSAWPLLLTYVWLDHFFDWDEIWTDIVKRPYITFGMLAFTLLIPLAFTSTKKMMKRLGKLFYCW